MTKFTSKTPQKLPVWRLEGGVAKQRSKGGCSADEYENVDRAAMIAALTRLLDDVIRRNEVTRVVQKPSSVDPALGFYSSREPIGSLKLYVLRIVRYTDYSAAAFITALIFMDRLVRKGGHYRLNKLNVHRLFLSCVFLSSKLLEDDCLPLKHFAGLGGVGPDELRFLELNLLNALDFNLDINADTYAMYERRFKGFVKPEDTRRRRKLPF
eukprot:Plantae.Rhodophyta-Purpureofilum_apyrenoidigerum.ctg8031.p1 GENE.Plantae.Rhodophyta-Purpureofilum_apyrenoidigerum.ctg8031~~Plantae.Rhodophyta-Purpureofilum_apyrenoidigerum.ctg8031.p1  ORF type:complete len:211 (-),score=39.69 Plantae.Rhodophyta-Purpureofilum_apyrenoidigerum.ctg8031:178-810(-)